MDTAHRLTAISNNKGSTLAFIALAIFAMVGFLGLTIDIGHLYVVRSELKNAADASALAGAAELYKDPLNPSASPSLDFARARTAATSFISKNKSDGVSLSNGIIGSGYWNIVSNTLDPENTIPTSQHVPAVTATINRSAGNNGGPVTTFFAKVFGVEQSAVNSNRDSQPSVAVSGFVGSSCGFPMALSSCMTDHYFSQDPMPTTLPQITISSVYVPGGDNCYTGQWTSLTNVENNVPFIIGLMDSYLSNDCTLLDTNSDIWIQPGAKASLYKEVNDRMLGRVVLMPIVGTSSGDILTHSQMRIKGFASFQIDSADQGKKTITGHFVDHFTTYPGTRPGGSVSNAVTAPLMVQ